MARFFGTSAMEVAEFYQQLGMLVQAELPLPESLRRLGEYFDKPDFQAALKEIGARADAGEKLGAILTSYPQFFSPLQVRMIEVGEAAEALPEALYAVGRLAQFNEEMIKSLRSALAYPLLTIHLACAILFYLGLTYVPMYRAIFEDMLEGARLPRMTELVMGVGRIIEVHAFWMIPCWIGAVIFSLWMVTPGRVARRMLLRVLGVTPGFMKVSHSLDSACVAHVLSRLVRRQTPIGDVLEGCAGFVERSKLRKALDRAAAAVRSGERPADALGKERQVDRLIELAFRHAPEMGLAERLEELAGLYERRAALSAQTGNAIWMMVMMTTAMAIVGCTMFAMFAPLTTIVTNMAQ